MALLRVNVAARAVWLCFALILLGLVNKVEGQTYTIASLGTPASCSGGEPCLVQPSVGVYKDGSIDITFNGYAYADMENSPTGLESLYVGECDIDENCGTKVTGAIANAYFFNGIATFADLMVKSAGTGYTLKYTLSDFQGNDLAFAFSSEFDVSVGALFKMDFYLTVGAGTGGSPFSPNPIVALTDKGGNAVLSESGSTVEVLEADYTVDINPTTDTTVTVENGYATFEGLYINEAGGPYTLRFITTATLPDGSAIPDIYSSEFVVSVGAASQMVFAENATVEAAALTAGEFFIVSPRVLIQDAGGNTLVDDHKSGVTISISDNPSDATLGLDTQLFEVAEAGVATFSTLTIDKVGQQYRLAFVYSSFDSTTNTYTASTSIVLYSERFNVDLGLGATLVTTTTVDNAWAGGQPFGVQPSLAIQDRGGNVVTTDYTSTLTATVVGSLSTNAEIVLDTTQNDATAVTNVTSSVTGSAKWWSDYGAGHHIVLSLTFNFEVWLTLGPIRPTLELNALDSGGNNVQAVFTGDVTAATKTLLFNYTVGTGDSVTANAPLDVASASALDLQGGSLVNGNGRAVSLVLPTTTEAGGLVQESVIINTVAPVAINITTDTATGEYGVGELINLKVLFDSPVAATGTPWIQLSAINVNSKMHCRANYTGTDPTSNNHTLIFSYLVREGDTSDTDDVGFPHWALTPHLGIRNETIYFEGAGSSIKRLSDIPTTDASTALTSTRAIFNAGQNITIDTTAPVLDTAYGIQAHADNVSETVYPGDHIPLFVKFDKPVHIDNSAITLTLACGSIECTAQFVALQSDEQTLKFTLEVPQLAASTDLDIVSSGTALLSPSQTTYIKRKATTPTQLVDASTTAVYSGGNSLKDTANIVVDGAHAATIVSVSNHNLYVDPTAPNEEHPRALYPDDVVVIAVEFAQPVVMSCSPVVIVQLTGRTREAVYAQGNLTNMVYFNYTVRIDDHAANLEYRYSPNALCLESGCPVSTSCTIKINSEEPTQAVSTTLPTVALSDVSSAAGVAFNDTVSVNGTADLSVRPSIITSIISRYDTTLNVDGTYDDPAGEYGAGNTIYFDVTFKDEVIWATGSTTLPKLWLNIGQWAMYTSGFQTETLTFTYTLTESDDTAALLPEDLSVSESPVYCSSGDLCEIRNRNNRPVDLSPASITDPQIVVDTAAPKVEWIWTNKTTSSYDGVYTIGEEIAIKLRWTKPVSITGKNPRLVMNVTADSADVRYATLNEALTNAEPNDDTMVFVYTVAAGEKSSDLTFVGPEVDRFFGLCYLYRTAGSLVTEVNYTLPSPNNPRPLADSPRGEVVAIDTYLIPEVESVQWVTAPDTYKPGDTLLFVVTMTRWVVLDGRATVKLRLGSVSLEPAVYVGCDTNYLDLDPSTAVSNAALLPSNTTKTLYFAYVLEEGQFMSTIDYVDSFAFDIGLTDLGVAGTLLAAATTPTLSAATDLPVPGALNSLSATYTLNAGDASSGSYVGVDGTPPYMSRIEYASPAGTYAAGSKVYINMGFTRTVVVTGSPSILMEPAVEGTQREATYVGGSGTDTLSFLFEPQPGDASSGDGLDYYVDRASLNSALASFKLNGGSIKLNSDAPTVDASVHLNPTGGNIRGTVDVTSTAGSYTYLDLAVKRRGFDYNIIFETYVNGNNRSISTEQVVFVSFSNEFELRGTEALVGDLGGTSVSVAGNYALVGAPGSNISLPTIQTITTQSTDPFLVPTKCIQLIGTEVQRLPAIMSFHTTGAVGTTVSGDFKIYHDNHRAAGISSALSRAIPANVNEGMLAAILQEDLPHLGQITVSREAYIYCACENAFTWSVTFTELTEGYVESLLFDTTGMNASAGAAVVGVVREQEAGIVDGYFQLHANERTSQAVYHNASTADIRTALAEVSLEADSVYISRPSATNPSRVLTWEITFEAYQHSYDIPLLTSTHDNLRGNGAVTWHQMRRQGVHGPGGMNGNFTVSFRGNATSSIPYNASAQQMKAALESLDTVNFVNVARSDPSSINGYTWTVELVSVNYNTPRGYVEETIANVEPMTATSLLIGTQVGVVVGTRYAMEEFDPATDAARAGTFGGGAGAAYLYTRSGDEWSQVALLHGNDTDSLDALGTATGMSLDGELLIVGAPAADMNGLYEIQSLYCSAASGTFTLSFRGWTSAEIAYDVSPVDLQKAIIGDSNFFDDGLYGVEKVVVADWGSDDLCGGSNTAQITFYSPLDAAYNLTGANNTFPNLQEITANVNTLLQGDGITAGTVTVAELQQGTTKLTGSGANRQQHGAAYIFRANCSVADATCGSRGGRVWLQEAQLFPLPEAGTSGDRFGSTVAMNEAGTLAVVGAPGGDSSRGHVYIYQYDDDDGDGSYRWELFQRVLITDTVAGDRLGSSLAIYDDTIVFGSPEFDGTGALFVYKRSTWGEVFKMAQKAVPNLLVYPLASGDKYGASVAIAEYYLAVGAPGRDDAVTWKGRSTNNAEADTGAVFVFERESRSYNFVFSHKLEPTNVRRLDRFGHSLAMHHRTIVVGSLEDFRGDLRAAKTIISITTSATYNESPLGATFVLLWEYVEASDGIISSNRQSTRDIMFDSTAAELEAILESDLSVGNVLVSRSRQDVYDGGYQWLVTFQDQALNVPLFEPDTTKLVGSDSAVTVEYVNTHTEEVRGKAHVFTLSSFDSNQGEEGTFTEQGFLFPFSHQANDQCGSAVALSNMFAVMGCPNRDRNVPNANAGSAGVYSLNILNTAFTSATYSVTEGGTLELPVVRREGVFTDWNGSDALLYIETFDRNAVAATQASIQNLFGIAEGSIPVLSTACDESQTVGTAVGRSQFYGSTHNESQWVGGMYDYRGISDYVPFKVATAFLTDYANVSQQLISTPDSILEAPDENISVVLHAPGFWPSVKGDLFSMVTVVDDDDGVYSSDFQYSKLYEDAATFGGNLGTSVSVCEACGYMVSGCPAGTAAGESVAGGKTVIYRHSDGQFAQETELTAPTAVTGMRYGDAVLVGEGFVDGSAILVVGEPNAYRAHVYINENTTDTSSSFTYDTELTATEATLRQHRFAAKGTLGLDKNILVIGAPGLEAVFVYYREWTNITQSWNWTLPTMLRSSEFDYDVLWTVTKLHRQEFGASVAVSGRTVAIGAPFADYDKYGTDLVEEDIDTEGPDIHGYAKGKVFMFYSQPAEEVIKLTAVSSMTQGTWRLRYENYGMIRVTDELAYSVGAGALETALETLGNIRDVRVSKTTTVQSDSSYVYSYTVTFLSEFGNAQPAGKLTPVWNGGTGDAACSSCTAFIPQNSDPTGQMYHDASNAMTAVLEQQALSSSDQRSGNRFGATVALDGDQLAASAVYSAGTSKTTWDFETGQLTGWGVTGSAFDYQPTYGDNSYLRPVYEPEDGFTGLRADAESSRLRGRYYIGTYEMRPGSAADYTVGDSAYSQGQTQGDTPVGTLTSDVFMVAGNQITFLVGGGCDIYSIYVELLVDGASVAKHTGKCMEKMDEVAFDTSLFHGRAAQIRIVDANTGKWGHINVDHFEFDWDVRGGVASLANLAYSVGGLTETPRTGVVYTYHLTQYDPTVSYDLCPGNKFDCVWTEEAKLIASDKRSHTFFGDSLSVNDELGILVIGSPRSGYTGFYKEAPTLYPFLDEDDSPDVTVVEFPAASRYMQQFQSKDTMTAESSGAYGVWYLSDLSGVPDYTPFYEDSGAAYVFTKEHAVASASGIDIPQRWALTEKVKLQAPDANARDYFGSSVDISGTTVAVGAKGDDGQQPDAGAVHMYTAGFASAYFSSLVYSALEGTDADVTVYVSRDPDVYAGELVLEYATSDLTATGVDATKFAECMGIAANLRGPSGCGDYQQTTGQLVIPVGSNEAGFKVNIMNDQCYERFLEFVQVTLSVPGSSVLQGETLSAKIRIDDDDFLSDPC